MTFLSARRQAIRMKLEEYLPSAKEPLEAALRLMTKGECRISADGGNWSVVVGKLCERYDERDVFQGQHCPKFQKHSLVIF